MIKATDLVCNKVRGGKRALWHAKHSTIKGITGAGNTADNAIKDFQKQYRWHVQNRAVSLIVDSW